MNAKKIMALVVVALMAICPLVVMADNSQGSDNDTQEFGRSVEFESITLEDAKHMFKFDSDTEDGFGSAYIQYIIMVLFPGLDHHAYDAVFEEVGPEGFVFDMGAHAKVKISEYQYAEIGKVVTQRAAVEVSTEDFKLTIKGDAMEGYPVLRDGKSFEGMFATGDYAKKLKDTFGFDAKYDGSDIVITGKLSAKVYIESHFEATASSIKGEAGEAMSIITAGGISIPMIPFGEGIPFSDVRAEISSDLSMAINGKQVEFETDTTAVAKIDVKNVFDVDADKVGEFSKFYVDVNDAMAKVTEKAKFAFDGKSASNNGITLDLSGQIRDMLDGRYFTVGEGYNVLIPTEMVQVKEITLNDIIKVDAPANDDSEQAAKDKIASKDGKWSDSASDAKDKTSDIANGIYNTSKKDIKAQIIALVAIVLAIVLAYFLVKKFKVVKKKQE